MLVFFAIILTVLLGFCGLAIDVGRMELRTNQLQAAADAGALAGAGELMHGGTGSNYQTAAANDAAAVEAGDGIPAGTVTTTVPASYGSYINDYSTVQVAITQSFPTFFLGLISQANSTITLSVKAVAEMPPCVIYSGSPNLTGAPYAYQIASAGMDAPIGCPVYSQTGVLIDGFAHIHGSQVRLSGASTSSVLAGGAPTSYTPSYNAPVITDPLAYVSAPATGSCVNGSPIVKLNQATATTVAFTPGTYCGKTVGAVTSPAIDIEGSYVGGPNQSLPQGGNCTSIPTVTFAPGLYVFVGGFTFNCVTVTGTGVTMYFTKNSSVAYGISKMISSTWNVSAAVDASNNGIPGVVVMNDRAWAGGNQDFQWTYSTWYGDGVVYLTGTGLFAYALAMSAPNYLNIVVPNMYTYDVEVRPSINYANLPAGNPLHTVVTLVQ